MIIQIDISEHESKYIRGVIVPWPEEYMPLEFSYTWPSNYVMFNSNSDATAFMLKFSGKRIKTKIEEMIEKEKDHA